MASSYHQVLTVPVSLYLWPTDNSGVSSNHPQTHATICSLQCRESGFVFVHTYNDLSFIHFWSLRISIPVHIVLIKYPQIKPIFDHLIFLLKFIGDM